ncbi:MAG: DEAD/DEAH box helicase [Gemmataceae bacterium]
MPKSLALGYDRRPQVLCSTVTLDCAPAERYMEVQCLNLQLLIQERHWPGLDRALQPSVRLAPLDLDRPGIRSLGKMKPEVESKGWRFPAPAESVPGDLGLRALSRKENPSSRALDDKAPIPSENLQRTRSTRLQPPVDAVQFKDRLLYLLQPPLENLFVGKQVEVPFKPYPYQLEGIAFLMPRHAALLADEMGLGKTMQAILSLRLLFHSGLVRKGLLVCPKSLVPNWSRELRSWAPEVPFEVISGDANDRRTSWFVSNCPLKLINYELLTRDAGWLEEGKLHFDVVVLDEAQRIKNRDSKTAQVVRSIPRDRSWALTGTPIENKTEDLINLFSFVDPDRVPADALAKQLAHLTGDCILRRTKDDVLTDLPSKTVRDAYVELLPPQREAYVRAEKEGIVHLNELGDTITVQHVFELIMRLKQICNFDPLTGQSSKLDQLQADLAEVAESGRKAIVFSQWVDPLQVLAGALAPLGPLQFHGRIPMCQRQAILEQFRQDSNKHVLLMTYGAGSVGLNLQFANYVFLFDRWWNPAVEDQAINRAHRIGQKEPVFVTRFVTLETIEMRIAEVLERKRQLFDNLIERNSSPPRLGLSEQEIFDLFNIARKPKRLAG